jgi:hypothetical protein
MLRYLGAGAFCSLVATACVDPQSDYNDYLNRTADARATPPSGGDDAELPDADLADAAGFKGTYAMVCGNQLVGNTGAQSTRFVANITYTPSVDSGGSFTFSDQPLTAGATTITDLAVGGDATTPQTVPVSPQGTCTISSGGTTIPGSADIVVQGAPIVFSDSALHFVISSSTQICASTTGDITAPVAETLVAGQNTCVFIPTSGAFTTPAGTLPSCP